jgi:hypothetical protein
VAKPERPSLPFRCRASPASGGCTQLLTALGAPHNPRATIVDLEQKAINLLKDAHIKVLVIDEVHNILCGSHRDQRVVLNTLRFLSNEMKMSLVLLRRN